MPDESQHVIEIVRVFKAPRELVWRCFTEAEHISQWWGPKGFATRVEEHNFTVGGRTRYVMTDVDGNEYPVEGTFSVIDPPHRFVSTDEFGADYDPAGAIDLPSGMVIEAIFDDVDLADNGQQGTRLTLKIYHPSADDRRKHEEMGVVGGWNSSFDCLDNYLAGSTNEALSIERDRVLEVMKCWGQAFCDRDVDAMMSLYASDFQLFDAIPPFRESDLDAYREKIAGCLPYFPETFGTDEADVRVTVDGSLALLTRLVRWTTEDPSHPAAQSWLRHTCGLKRSTDGWKIFHEHCSVPFDPETMKAYFTLDA